MLKDNAKTTRLMIQARMRLKDFVNESGGCDHDANICVCGDTAFINAIDDMLFEAYGMNMMWEFYHAEPGNHMESNDAAISWASEARAAIHRIVNDRMDDVSTVRIPTEPEDFPI